ncbi:MAG TPA: polysaccharide biosynthesis/export family protein [Allosphingosinicella sp.]|uniref:polysaccharide biosynthesis/export family protein n=1 Tax=Allosphingosinicella sp. TaxID=2823234 RepID=UPI002ED85119
MANNSALPPPTGADLYGETRPYLIGPFDKLSVSVFGLEDLSQNEVQTDASGRISIPVAGTIEAAGKTPSEIAAVIEDRLRARHVRHPQVTVNLKETVSQVVTVDGEVKEPGLYPVIGKMTLMRAIARARGLTELAKTDNVLVFRTVNGQRMAGLYNLKAIRQGNYADPEVFANDVVIVSDSQARRIFKDVLQASPILSAPLVAVFQ